MKPISVVIPTANHPGYLRTALQSVSAQTAVDSIQEVIVSENGKVRDSEKVCSEFGNLPIRYIFHEEPLSILGNFFSCFRAARAELIAFLCDDDWWAPGHLQSALLCLSRYGRAVASFSVSLHVESEEAMYGDVGRSNILWLAAGKPRLAAHWLLQPHEVVATVALHTPFHLSTMVVRRDGLLRSAGHLEFGHSYALDRDLYLALTHEGLLVYTPFVDTYIRCHRHTYTQTLDRVERQRIFQEQTDRIWEYAMQRGIELATVWQKHLTQAPSEVLDDVGRVCRLAMGEKYMLQRGFGQVLPATAPVRLWGQGINFSRRATRWLKRGLVDSELS